MIKTLALELKAILDQRQSILDNMELQLDLRRREYLSLPLLPKEQYRLKLAELDSRGAMQNAAQYALLNELRPKIESLVNLLVAAITEEP